MSCKYFITQLSEKEFEHKLVFEDENGVRQHSLILDLPNKLFLEKHTCRVCGIKHTNMTFCETHKHYKSRKMTEFFMFSKAGYTNNAKLPNASSNRRQTNVKRYGVENVSKNEKIKRKAELTMLERYGVSNPAKNKQLMEKRSNNNLKKYGVVTNLSFGGVNQKAMKNKLDKCGGYGFDVKQLQEKSYKTNLKKYGAKFYSQTQQSKNKTSERIQNLSKEQKKEIQRKRDTTRSLNKYGVEDISIYKDQFRQNAEQFGFNKALTMLPFKLHRQAARIHYYSQEERNQSKGSLTQDSVIKYIEEQTGIQFEQNIKSIVPGNNMLEIDALNREHRISIEYDGFYWHRDKRKRDLEKAELMRSIGYRHFNLDETTEDLLPVLSRMIKPNKTRLFARKLELKEIDNLKEFLDQNHLQGSASASLCLGLFDGDRLIQTMTFGKPRFNKNYQWEIVRLCTDIDYIVVGGTEKLWKAFLDQMKPSSVISYSDNRFFSGDIYQKLDMKLSHTSKPNYVWYHRNGDILKRYQTQRHKLEDLFDEEFDRGLSEYEIMTDLGYEKISDLGNKVWTWG